MGGRRRANGCSHERARTGGAKAVMALPSAWPLSLCSGISCLSGSQCQDGEAGQSKGTFHCLTTNQCVLFSL